MKIKVFIILAALITGIVSVGCSDKSSNLDDYYDYYSEAVIENVKTGTNSIFNFTTYGEAFENFFTNTSWEYYDGRVIYGNPDNEKDIVLFEGDCTYESEEVRATIEFTVYDDGTFRVTSLSFNDIPQSDEVLTHFISTIFISVVDSQDQELSDFSAQNSSDTIS